MQHHGTGPASITYLFLTVYVGYEEQSAHVLHPAEYPLRLNGLCRLDASAVLGAGPWRLSGTDDMLDDLDIEAARLADALNAAEIILPQKDG